MTQQALVFAPAVPSVTHDLHDWWSVGGAIGIKFIHLTDGWRFWIVRAIDEEIGDFPDLGAAVAAARAEIQRDPVRYAAEAARRLSRGHRLGPEVQP